MTIADFNIYTALSSFTEKGMEIIYNPKVPRLDDNDLRKIANYYSIILNYGENKALYGPLPVAYHTEYLLYVYTFSIKNEKIQDERIIKNDNLVPTFLLIFFPTSHESYTSKARDNISLNITNWLTQFTELQNITEKKINNLNSQIETAVYNEKNQYALSEIEEANVVIGKSMELLYNVVKYQDKPVKILISGTDDLLLSIARKAIIENNSLGLRYYKFDNDKIEFKFDNADGLILVTTPESPQTHKFLSNNLDGVLHFGNFSTPKTTEDHTNELQKIIRQTSQTCIITFVISQNKSPIKINDTAIPDVLKECKGRSISLIDLAQEKNTISTSIIEFLDNVIESIGKR